MRRLAVLGVIFWLGRWAARQAASQLARRLPRGPAPKDRPSNE